MAKNEKLVDLKPEKVTPSQLEKIQTIVSNINKSQMEIGRLETSKHMISHQVVTFQDDANNTGGLTSANGVVVLTGSPQNIEICWVANSNSNGLNIDNISLREVQGHPAFVSGALINQDDNPTA